MDSVADLPMPMLSIANEVSPLLGLVMCLIIFGMIVNTAVGTLFSFLSRLLPAGTAKFRWGSVVTGVVARGSVAGLGAAGQGRQGGGGIRGCCAAQSPASQLPQGYSGLMVSALPVGAGLPAIRPVQAATGLRS